MTTNLIMPDLSLQKSCDHVINSVRASCLNFSIHETPYSVYLSVRKSFSKSKTSPKLESTLLPSTSQKNMYENEIEALKAALKDAEMANNVLVNKYEEAVDDSETSHTEIKRLQAEIDGLKVKGVEKVESEIIKKNKIIQDLNSDKLKLESEVSEAEKNWKSANKSLKIKDKELHDLHKESNIILESYGQTKDELRDLKSKLNKEIKTNEKIQKKKDKKESLDNLKVPTVPFECSLCDVKLESLLKLNSHYKLCHMKASFTQTLETVLEDKSVQSNTEEFYSDKQVQTSSAEFQKFPCFYCNINIVGEYHLQEHRIKCRGSTKMGIAGVPNIVVFPPPLPFANFGFRGYPWDA